MGERNEPLPYSSEWRKPPKKLAVEQYKYGAFRSGLLMRVRSGSLSIAEILIGDINELGGTCDDCSSEYLDWELIEYRDLRPEKS